MSFHDRIKLKDNFTSALFACPAAVLLVWNFFSSSGLAGLMLNCYVLVAGPLYVLVGSYPPIRSLWFWKAIPSIAILVSLVLYAELQVASWSHNIGIKLPSRMAFGVTGCVAVLEAVIALRIVDATQPRDRNTDSCSFEDK